MFSITSSMLPSATPLRKSPWPSTSTPTTLGCLTRKHATATSS
ncbi:hypothetical protein BN1708_018052 [Verticillium longisporum]|uniref:Uncharacterized protein n=1 Tax=Verticillium longisporum TaxID=100787 RepID=A0A0G4LNR5_VERLO|nr:hypothetical protein BN1708_018052 [Verticillium longisporum]